MKKTCTKCKKIKSVDKFSRNKNNPDGLKYQCKECSRKEYHAKRENGTICSQPDCKKNVYAKNLCITHYHQLQNYGKCFRKNIRTPNDIIIKEEHALIILRNKKCRKVAEAIIDIDNIELIKNYKWSYNKRTKLVTTSSKNKQRNVIVLSRLINKTGKNMRAIHKNGNPLDFRRKNLENTTSRSISIKSKLRKDNTTGYKGVYFDSRRNKWYVRITVNSVNINGGTFSKIEDAIQERKNLEKIHFKNL